MGRIQCDTGTPVDLGRVSNGAEDKDQVFIRTDEALWEVDP